MRHWRVRFRIAVWVLSAVMSMNWAACGLDDSADQDTYSTGGAGFSGTGGFSIGDGGLGVAGGITDTSIGAMLVIDAGVSESALDTGGTADASGAAGKPDIGNTPDQTLPPVADYGMPGPFPATQENDQGPGDAYTIFRPDPLGKDGFRHPLLIWGCGMGTTPAMYVQFLSKVASHGFVVVASNSPRVNQKMMRDGLDWIIAQNNLPGVYRDTLDVTRAVSMGYSIGGTAAVLLGDHPSVVTTVSIHGHKAQSALHGPLLQTTGTKDTVGVPLQQATYDQSNVQTFLATLDGATHFEILGAGGGREGVPIIAWLRFWVYKDEGARHFFYGDDCVLCVFPWTNPQRKNWK